jgi:hypothetical protein
MNLSVDPKFCELLTASYTRLVGGLIIPREYSTHTAARWLYEEAPFCVLAHDGEPDPIFIYANKRLGLRRLCEVASRVYAFRSRGLARWTSST